MIKAALFDFDGVVVDTEPQYSLFWHRMGVEYIQKEDLEILIKGQTLTYIFNTYFPGMEKEQAEITQQLNELESNMQYDYIAGFEKLIGELRANGVKTAIVTSSNDIKMQAAYRAHPELKVLFDAILTSEDFSESKPSPECYLTGMKRLGATPETTVVFEDSFNGLKAGKASDALVIGLSTTNKKESIEALCHVVVPDFTHLNHALLEKLNATR